VVKYVVVAETERHAILAAVSGQSTVTGHGWSAIWSSAGRVEFLELVAADLVGVAVALMVAVVAATALLLAPTLTMFVELLAERERRAVSANSASRSNHAALESPYAYRGFRLRLRLVYLKLLDYARSRGLRVEVSNTLLEIARALRILDRYQLEVESFYYAMYGKCLASCEDWALKAEKLARATT
jgi:hypothetical protein